MNNVSIQKTEEVRNDVSVQGETVRQNDRSGQFDMLMEDKAGAEDTRLSGSVYAGPLYLKVKTLKKSSEQLKPLCKPN